MFISAFYIFLSQLSDLKAAWSEALGVSSPAVHVSALKFVVLRGFYTCPLVKVLGGSCSPQLFE